MNLLEDNLRQQAEMREMYGDPADAIRGGGMRAQLNILGWSDLVGEEVLLRLAEKELHD